MMAQGEALGVLYLSATETGAFTQSKRELAITVAEQIALALANLKLHEALQQQSIRDSLTGLFNRRYLEESLEREVSRAERKQQTVGIIMLDIDHFKRFNDTFGHDAGDTVLRELGIFLKKNIRGSDIACRFGGEELLIILPEADLSVTLQRAEQIREGIKHLNLHSRNQQLGTITLSLGVGIFPQHGITGDMVIQAADIALYQAKAQGRDRVIVAS
jgi:diguanylate cyclase (GGDEF)-like protein